MYVMMRKYGPEVIEIMIDWESNLYGKNARRC